MIVVILLVFMIVGSIIAVETRDLLSSVIAVGAVGLGLAVVFLLLGAPDLAIVQVVVEGLALAMLLRLVVVREDVTITHRYTIEGVFATACGLIFAGVFIVIAAIAFREIPPFGQPRLRIAEEIIRRGFAETHAPNIVTDILLDYRGYDTLGEATVIFAAIIGALAILRRKGRVAS
jgi:multisubunit Na+/H+ antiporter MnhB subunit